MKDKQTIAKRIDALRLEMERAQVDAWIVYTADPHMSEYLPAHWRGRAWLSGFKGSAGFVVVTQTKAALWTDNRYWEQATIELQGSGIELMPQGASDTLDVYDWLIQNLSAGSVLGVDGMTLSITLANTLHERLSAHQISIASHQDLLASIWLDRPALPTQMIFHHNREFTGLSRLDKINAVRQKLRARNVDWHLISSLDDIAWLLNLRGSDISYNPVFLSYLLVGLEETYLFIDVNKLTDDTIKYLNQDGIVLFDYLAIGSFLDEKNLDTAVPSATKKHNQATIWLDPNRTAWNLREKFKSELVLELNPSQLFKAQKTPIEIANIRQAMEQDGVALCEFFSAFEKQLAQGKVLSELDVDEQLTAARARQPYFVSPSFGTIAGYNENGAMPHYSATKKSHAQLKGNGLLLIDSGGQYLNGTTDITRVIPIGEPSQEQKSDFTLVLKAMIALSRAVFPRDISSQALDSIARMPLWQAGLDYGHGTGHGVGYFLNVHEGPQVISYHGFGRLHTEMKEGMVTSNEPGLYRPGKWGVRIENLVCNQLGPRTEFGKFLQFETLTLCPIDTRCILKDKLDQHEIDWLNHYHQEVRERLQPLLKENVQALNWLLERTQAITRIAS